MTTLRGALVAGGCCLFIAACSSGTPSPPPTVTVTAQPSSRATIAQYAGVVAESDAALQRDYQEFYSVCGLSTPDVNCRLLLLNYATDAHQLAAALERAATMLGMPPNEIIALVAATTRDAQGVTAGYNRNRLHDTEQSMAPMVLPGSRLHRDLLEWTPYGA